MNSPLASALPYGNPPIPYRPKPQPVKSLSEDEREFLFRLPQYLNVGIRIEGAKTLDLRRQFAAELDRRWKERKVPKKYRPFAVFWLFVVGGDVVQARRQDREHEEQQAAFSHDTLGMFAISERLSAAKDVQAEITAILGQIEEQIRDLIESEEGTV